MRGLPSLLIYVKVLSFRQRVEMTLITATTMPLLIALAEIGQRDGVMLPSNAAALVGAGVVSVLLFPALAAVLHRKGKKAGHIGEAVPVAGSVGENATFDQSRVDQSGVDPGIADRGSTGGSSTGGSGLE